MNGTTECQKVDTSAPDWYEIEQDCRNTKLPITVIARKHGVSDSNLWNKCYRHGWRLKTRHKGDGGKNGAKNGADSSKFALSDEERARDDKQSDPVERPESASNAEGDAAIAGSGETFGNRDPMAIPLTRALVTYVNTRHEPGSPDATIERVILEGAALQLQLIREHRGDIRNARTLALTLMNQLEEAATLRAPLEDAIHELQEAGPKRAAMMRAVSLPTHIAAMRDLSTTLRQLIPLERQALGIADTQPIEPNDPRDPVDHVAQRVELGELEKAIEQQLARVSPAQSPVE